MPKNATPEQRLRWHLEHEKHCACRELTEKMRAELERLAQRAQHSLDK